MVNPNTDHERRWMWPLSWLHRPLLARSPARFERTRVAAKPPLEAYFDEYPELRRRIIADRFNSAGDRARNARNWPEAAKRYLQSLDVNPDQPEIWVQYGHTLKEQGDLDGAEKAYRRAAREHNAADTHLMLAHLLKDQKQYTAAASSYLTSLLIDPTQIRARDELFGFGYSQEELDIAIKAGFLPWYPLSPHESLTAGRNVGEAQTQSELRRGMRPEVRVVKREGLQRVGTVVKPGAYTVDTLPSISVEAREILERVRARAQQQQLELAPPSSSANGGVGLRLIDRGGVGINPKGTIAKMTGN